MHIVGDLIYVKLTIDVVSRLKIHLGYFFPPDEEKQLHSTICGHAFLVFKLFLGNTTYLKAYA